MSIRFSSLRSRQAITARLEQLLAARGRLANLGAKIVLVAPGPASEPLRRLATGKILIADRDTADVARETLGLFTRSFHNRQQNVVRCRKCMRNS